MQVKVEGVTWTNWKVVGREIVVGLEDLESQAGYWATLGWDASRWDFFNSAVELIEDNVVTLAYDFKRWNATTQSFDTNSVTELFRIGDAEEHNEMPADYVRGAPVVITDDEKDVPDERSHQLQFKITEPTRAVLFNMEKNLVRNPHFSKHMSGWPAFWYRQDPTGAQLVQGSGYVGDYYLSVQGTGKVMQEVNVTGGQPLVAQAWVRAPGSGLAVLELAYRTPGSGRPIVDQSGVVLGQGPNFTVYSHRATGAAGPDWSRISIVLTQGTEFDPSDALYPDICDRMEVRLASQSGRIEFGAVQLRSGLRAGLYNYASPTGTVEFETDPTGFWQHHPKVAFPYEDLWDVGMNPVNDEAHDGFLAVTEEGEPTDDDLGIGRLTWDDPAAYGTGYPQGVVPWPSGVRHEFGRRHLPYAKIRGHQKMRQTQAFDLENQPPSMYEVTEPRRSRDPHEILIASPANAFRDASGDPRLVIHQGSGKRMFVAGVLLDEWGNPIIGDWVRIVPSGALQADPTGAYTNHGGRVVTNIWAPTTGAAKITFVHHASSVEGEVDVEILT